MDSELSATVRRLKETNKASLGFPLFIGEPLSFQAAGAEMAYVTKRMLLMDPVGLGKTIQAILLASKIIQDCRERKRKSARILIAVESDTLLQWRGEIRKFLGVDAIEPVGEKSSRAKKYQNIASRDIAVVLINHSKLFVDFDMIVNWMKPDMFAVDEAAIIANRNKTHEFATWVARICEYVLLITAEPITRGDLVQIRNCFAVMGIPLCESEDEFIDKFVTVERKMVWVRGKYGPFKKAIVTPTGVKNLKEFKSLIFNNAIRRPESVLGAKRIINRQLISVDMGKVQRERYAEITKKILTAKNESKEIDALTTASYLSQVLCSPWIVDDTAPKESPKAEALVRLAKKLAPEKMVVFAKWKKMHKLLDEFFKKADVKALFYSGDLERNERYEEIQKFKEDPSQQVLVMTQAGQKGLNLQIARNIVIMDLLHSPAAMRQILGRVDRIGQLANVINFYMIVANDSTEMNILKVLKDRQSVIDGVFNESKAELFNDSFSAYELLLNLQ